MNTWITTARLKTAHTIEVKSSSGAKIELPFIHDYWEAARLVDAINRHYRADDMLRKARARTLEARS